MVLAGFTTAEVGSEFATAKVGVVAGFSTAKVGLVASLTTASVGVGGGRW